MDNSDAGKTITVLLYERSPRLAIAITKILEKSAQIGQVTRTDNPRRISELVKSTAPDVVLVDSDRPVFDLVELCRQLSKEHSTPIVLFSTRTRQEPVHAALAAGAHSLVSWPFRPRDLVMAVVHAAWQPGHSTIAALSELRDKTELDNNLRTSALAPFIEWASKETLEQVSPRLRTARQD